MPGLLTDARAQNHATREEEPRVIVHSEDSPERVLLETRICKEDGFQKQQGMSFGALWASGLG